MEAANGKAARMPVVTDLADFDRASGNRLERSIFNHRGWVMLASLVLTLFLALQLRGLTLGASFEKMLPQSHPYIQNYLKNRAELRGLGDSVRIVIENAGGDLFDKRFLEELAKINDEVFLLPGVDRAWMKSIWTPVVRWTEVTEEGFVGGPVMPARFDGTPKAIDELRLNIGRAGVVGSLVADDFRSGVIVVRQSLPVAMVLGSSCGSRRPVRPVSLMGRPSPRPGPHWTRRERSRHPPRDRSPPSPPSHRP